MRIIYFFKRLMRGEFLKNRWYYQERATVRSKTSQRTTVFHTALSTGSLKLYLLCKKYIQQKKYDREEAFCFGRWCPKKGGAHCSRGPKAKKDNIITKKKNLVHQLLLLQYSFLSTMVYQKDTTCPQLLRSLLFQREACKVFVKGISEVVTAHL